MDNIKFRVVYDYNYRLGKHQYIIECFRKKYDPSKIFQGNKEQWVRFGGGYFFDDKNEAIQQCDNLNNGKTIIY